jgi:hypothetical protein
LRGCELEDKDSFPGSGVDFCLYHHIHTISSIHPTTCGNDALLTMKLKRVTYPWLAPRAFLSTLLCIHDVGRECVHFVVANFYDVMMESSPDDRGRKVLIASAVPVQTSKYLVLVSLNVGISRQNHIITRDFDVMKMINHNFMRSVDQVPQSDVNFFVDLLSLVL